VSGLLGKGSLAVVYGGKLEGAARAGAASEEGRGGEDVAVKVLLPKVIDKEKVRAEFRMEAKLWSSLDHPNVTLVRDVLEVGRDTAIVSDVVVLDAHTLAHTHTHTHRLVRPFATRTLGADAVLCHVSLERALLFSTDSNPMLGCGTNRR